MLKLEQISARQQITGIEQDKIVRMVSTTPHNGKEAEFQLFMSLLDGDRFYGRFRDGVHQVDISDMLRRMVKEELLKFDGTPLFPERRAITATYRLSDQEAELYALVTDYVKNEMNKADNLDGKRRGSVGFALTMLQRRLASSPEAIYQSLKRRRQRLERRIEDEKVQNRGHLVSETYAEYGVDNFDDADEQLSESEFENLADTLVDQATAARTIEELENEVATLQSLENKAKTVVHSGQDCKWEQLSSILQDDDRMKDSNGKRVKLIMYALNQEDKFWLGVVFVDEDDAVDGPYYVQKPFKIEPDWGVASLNYDVNELLGIGGSL